MSRSMVYAAIVLSGVAFAVFWTAAPVCLGGFCPGAGSAPEAQRWDSVPVREVS